MSEYFDYVRGAHPVATVTHAGEAWDVSTYTGPGDLCYVWSRRGARAGSSVVSDHIFTPATSLDECLQDIANVCGFALADATTITRYPSFTGASADDLFTLIMEGATKDPDFYHEEEHADGGRTIYGPNPFNVRHGAQFAYTVHAGYPSQLIFTNLA